MSGSPRLPPCRVLPPVVGRSRSPRPRRRRLRLLPPAWSSRPGPLARSRWSFWVCWSASRSLCFRSSCLRSSCCGRPACGRPACGRPACGRPACGRPAALVLPVVLLAVGGLVLVALGPVLLGGGRLLTALFAGLLAALRPTCGPTARLACGLSPGLGALDRVDQLGLLHRARTRDAQATGHRLQVGDEHGVESAGALLGRRVAGGVEGFRHVRSFPRISAVRAGTGLRRPGGICGTTASCRHDKDADSR